MGGFGSGRQGGKACTDNRRSIDVRRLHRDGYLKPGMAFEWQWLRNDQVVSSVLLSVHVDLVTFIYKNQPRGGPWEDVCCVALLDRTPCTYGGTRTWWLCPCCKRRVALLYMGKTPACRHCYCLAYRSERETVDDRAARQINKLRDRLGWKPGFLNGKGLKPKGMHWRTFERLQAQHDALVQATLTQIHAALGRAPR